MRLTHLNYRLAAFFAVLTMFATSILAKPPNDSTPPPPAIPAVSYWVDYVAIDGLRDINNINDLGECAVTVETAFAPVEIDTAERFAAAIVNVNGQVQYLDNLISAFEPWDLLGALDINNAGEIVGNGVKNGVRVSRLFLLRPNSESTGYVLTDLGEGHVASINEQGDVFFQNDDQPMVRLNDGTLLSVGKTGHDYYGLNSLPMLYGYYTDSGSAPGIQNYFKSDFSGNEYPLQFYSSNAYNHFGLDVADNGYSITTEFVPRVKIKGGYKDANYFVVHNSVGNPTKITLPSGFENATLFSARINSQLRNGQSLLVGDHADGVWLRFPGYEACFLSQLMDPAEQAAFDLLGTNAGSRHRFVTTPRNPDGSVNHTAAPTLIDTAFPLDATTNGYDGWAGICLIRPIAP